MTLRDISGGQAPVFSMSVTVQTTLMPGKSWPLSFSRPCEFRGFHAIRILLWECMQGHDKDTSTFGSMAGP